MSDEVRKSPKAGETNFYRSSLLAWCVWQSYNRSNQNRIMLKLNSIFRLVIVLSLLSAGISRAQDATTPLDVYDGFETPTLSKVWSADRFAPGAVQMQMNIFRAGLSAVQITVRANDKFEAGINGNSDSERAELLEVRKL